MIRRLTAAIAAAAAIPVVPLLAAAPADADPCSVFSPGPQARMPQTVPSAPRLPIPHLPIGRKPADPNTTSAPSRQSAMVTPSATQSPRARVAPIPQADLIPTGALAQPAALVPPAGVSAASVPTDVAVPRLAPTQAAPQPSAAAATPSQATPVGWVNGPYSPNNTYPRFGISGADLGIMWDNGYPGANNQVLMAFGDTFGNCNITGQEWRSNTLFRTADRNLADGIAVPDPVYGNPLGGSPVPAERPNFSRQIIDSLGIANQEVTVIPTAGISVGTTQYCAFMSVASWGNPGSWSTNFSAIAVSTDNGENWTVPRSSVRPSWFFSVPSNLLTPNMFIWGYQNFQQAAFVRGRGDGYLYAFGTGAGRGGMAFVSRVKENAVTNVWSYEYYSPFGWIPACPFCAVQVIWDATSEMSVAFNDYLNKFIVLYTNALNNVVMRTADKPEGPWSDATTLVTSTSQPGLYAPYIHPWSTGKDLYFNLSMWGPYSVQLMHTELG